MLVQLLNGLLKKYTGKRISRAKGFTGNQNAFDYVLEVCRIANPDLKQKRGLTTVQEAVKEVVKEDRANEDSHGFDGWEELIPHWKPANKLSIQNRKFGIRAEFHKPGGSFYWSITTSPRTPRSAVPIFLPIQPFVPDKERR
jgi:hypothetical protein